MSDLDAEVSREDIFKPTLRNESSHEISNDNGVRVVNFPIYKNLVAKSTIFTHLSIHKYIWTSPDGKTRNQTNHVLTDRRYHSSIIDVRSFRGADCDADHYLVAAKVREILAGSPVNKMDMDRFSLKKLSVGEVKEQYQVTIETDFLLWKI
jgi:hypothetical protein